MSNYKSYFYKSLGLREDSLPGGNGDETKETQVDPEQLQMGVKVEMEHTHDPDLAKEIAMDHLSEDPHYYSHLKDAGLADELPNNEHGETKPKLPMMQKLFSPTAIMPTPVIAVGVRGTRTGLLPAGGIVDDPEKARLGGLELVKNLKPNSQGAIANTPASDAIKADGGHYTPDNKEITKGKAPTTNVKGDDVIHPMQVQQLGNEPFKDDGTTRDGEHTPPAAGGEGDAPKPLCKNADSSVQTAADTQEFKPNKEPKEGPWGIDMDDEDEEEEKGEVNIDIKETLKEAQKRICGHCKKPRPCPCDKYDEENQEESDPESPKFNWNRFGGAGAKPADYKENTGKKSMEECGTMKSRFQQLANIPPTNEAGALSEKVNPQKMQQALTTLNRKNSAAYEQLMTLPMGFIPSYVWDNPNDPWWNSDEAESKYREIRDASHEGPKPGKPIRMPPGAKYSYQGSLDELEELVGRLNKKGKVTPLLAKAQKYLEERKKKQ